MVRFTVRMRARVLQTAPLAYFSILIPILSNKVGNSVQEVTQTVLHLREIELLRQKKGTR